MASLERKWFYILIYMKLTEGNVFAVIYTIAMGYLAH